MINNEKDKSTIKSAEVNQKRVTNHGPLPNSAPNVGKIPPPPANASQNYPSQSSATAGPSSYPPPPSSGFAPGNYPPPPPPGFIPGNYPPPPPGFIPGNYPLPPPGFAPSNYPPPPGYGPGVFSPPFQPNGPQNPYVANPGFYPPPFLTSNRIIPKDPKKIAKGLRKVSIGANVVFFIAIAFFIIFIIFEIVGASYVTSSSPMIRDYGELVLIPGGISFGTFGMLFWGIGVLVCAIVGSIRASALKKLEYKEFNIVMILYIIGIFFLIPTAVAAFMAISRIKKNSKLSLKNTFKTKGKK